MIARLIYRQLPHWARPTHPMMRYVIGYRPLRRGEFLLRTVLGVLLAALVIGISYLYTAENTSAAQPTYREIMYYPLVATTLLMQLLAIGLTVNSVALERQKGTWDSLQITLAGAATSVRARWALVFYRLRWILAIVFALRLGYLVFLLDDLTDFEGRAIDARIIGISPEVSLEVTVFLIAALMTAAVMQPFVALAFDAAVGMLVAVVTKRRNIGILTTVFLLVGRVLVTGVALFLGNQVVNASGTTINTVSMNPAEAWIRTLLLATQGDLSLRLLNLEALGNVWADLNNGIYIGGVVLLLVMLQAALANGMVIFAAKRAAKPNRF